MFADVVCFDGWFCLVLRRWIVCVGLVVLGFVLVVLIACRWFVSLRCLVVLRE